MSDVDALTILGLVLLVGGAVALVYGHVELLELQQSSGFFAFGGDASSEAVRQWKLVRLGGLVAGAVGAVLTLAGAADG